MGKRGLGIPWISVWVGAVVALTGCSSMVSQPVDTPHGEVALSNRWTGRLSVTLQHPQPQRHVVRFDLSGSAETGEWWMDGPFGNRLAKVTWDRAAATLEQSGQVQHYPTMDALTHALLGQSLPLHGLFDWLNGNNVQQNGWQVDLSRHAEGRIHAVHATPDGHSVDVLLVLDRPTAPTPAP